MRFSELQRKLEKAGWQIARTGKHHIYIHSDKPGTQIPIGKHKSEEVPIGTLNKILKLAGLK